VLGVALVVRIGAAAIVAGTLAVMAVMGAAVGLALAVAQPLIAHAGCTLCLCSTVVSVVLAAGAVAEGRDRWSSGRPKSLEGRRVPKEETR
jgi:membrane protein implicated in regulation of membrane protease activity